MKKIISILLAVVLIFSSLSVSVFAVTKDEANARLTQEHAKFSNLVNTKFDTDGSESINAADARNTLIYSAGLALEGADTSKMDTDGDGKVTAIDARNILRLAAKLDSINAYLTTADMLDYFDSIIDSIKINNYSYYKWCSNTTNNVTYEDVDGVVASLDKQLKSLALITGEDISFSDELVASKGDVTYTYNRNAVRYTDYTYPVAGESRTDLDNSCYLTADNVLKVEYKQNQSFTYSHYMNSSTPSFTTNTITGLDSITVWIKTDSFTTFPEDLKSLNHGKIFNVLTEDTVMDSINEGNSMGSLDGLADMGTCEVSVGYISMKYSNSYVTIYINPYTGNPVAADYSMHYDMKMYMDMNINLKATDNISMLKGNGRVNLTNTITERTVYSFWNSNFGYTNYMFFKPE